MLKLSNTIRASGIINIETYDNVTNVIVSKSDGDKILMGRVYIMTPLSGGGAEVKTVISNVFKTAPDDTLIQVNQVSRPDFGAPEFLERGKTFGGEVVQDLIHRRINVFKKALNPDWSENTPLLNDKKIIITCAVPVPDTKEKTFQNQFYFQQEFQDQLKNSGFFDVRSMSVEELTTHYRDCLDLFTQNPVAEIDHNQEVRYQVYGPDNTINNKDDLVFNNNVHVSVVTVKKFPKKGKYGLMSCVCGAPFNHSQVREGGGNRISVPYIVSTTIRVANQRREQDRVEKAINSRKHDNKLPFSLDQEDPLEKLDDLRTFKKQFSIDGNKIVEVSVNIFLYGKTSDQARIQASRVKTQMDSLDYDARVVKDNAAVRFAQMLPLNFSPKIANKVEGEGLMTARAVAPHLPIISDFTGNVPRLNAISSAVTYMTRRGSLYTFNPFNTISNPNGIYVADSGAGKSFALQDRILCHLADGEKVVVIDEGNSQKKFALSVNGEFNEFSYNSPFKPNLNPFANLTNDQFNEQSETISALLLMMCYGDEKIQSGANIAMSEAVRSAYGSHGEDTEIKHVVDALENVAQTQSDNPNIQQNEVLSSAVNLISRLKSFIENPKRGMFFKGSGNIDPKAQFSVFELSGLGDDAHLKKVVVFFLVNMLIGRLSKYKGKKHLLVDEALSFVKDESAVDALDGLYQKSRKAEISVFLIVQSLSRLSEVPAGNTIINLSNWKIFLMQPAGEAENIVNSVYLDDLKKDPYFGRMLKDIKLEKGHYSEMLIVGNKGYEAVRLYPDPLTMDLLSSEGKMRDVVIELIDQGMNPIEAVKQVRADKDDKRKSWLSGVLDQLIKIEGVPKSQVLSDVVEILEEK